VDVILSGKNETPWANIDSCVTTEYLRQELKKSQESQRTASCKTQCGNCGISSKITPCLPNTNAIVNQEKKEVNENPENKTAHSTDPSVYRVLFGFSKEGSAVFHGHLSLIEIFSMAFRRADIPVLYTQGFNPLPKMEFASPLSVGISAELEIASVEFREIFSAERFIASLNDNLPSGIVIKQAESFLIKSGMKKHSLSSLLWGFQYRYKEETDFVNAKEDKIYRQNKLNDRRSLFSLKRSAVLARKIGDTGEWALYFDVYRALYPDTVI